MLKLREQGEEEEDDNMKRLGRGKWEIKYKGKKYKRKIQRKIKNGRIERSVKINGKNIKVN